MHLQDVGRLERAGPLALEAGRVLSLVGPPGTGLTRLALTMLAEPAKRGMVAALDVRGWFSPQAAWEAGIGFDRIVVVRPRDAAEWARVTATLVEGMQAVYAEVPERTKDAVLRKLAALARNRRTPVVLRPLAGGLPAGVAHLRIETDGVSWEGTDAGHGRLVRRRLNVMATGRAVGGIPTRIEVEDDGADAVRVVPGLATAEAGRAAG